MISVSGSLRTSEVQGQASTQLLREAGLGRAYWIVFVASPVVCVTLGGFVERWLQLPSPLGILIGSGVAFALTMVIAHELLVVALRRKLPEMRGTHGFPFRATIETTGLTYETAGVRGSLSWLDVEDLSRGRNAWKIASAREQLCVPKRLFADEAAEKAFFGEALRRMTKHCRDRSYEAVVFCGGESAIPAI